MICLDGLPATTPVSGLAALQVRIYVLQIHGKARRHAAHDGRETRAVALPCCDVLHATPCFPCESDKDSTIAMREAPCDARARPSKETCAPLRTTRLKRPVPRGCEDAEADGAA